MNPTVSDVVEVMAQGMGKRMARIILRDMEIAGDEGPLVELNGKTIDEAVEGLATAAIAALSAAGYVIVPVEPTAEMLEANREGIEQAEGFEPRLTARDTWKLMIRAAELHRNLNND